VTNPSALAVIFECELLLTGKHAYPDDFYDGSSLGVVVDEEGNGSVVVDLGEDTRASAHK
jgi:hypothetical protein